jgi:hypothetical protein
MKRQVKVVALVAALVAAPVAAHEKGDRAMGIVESVTPERIVVKTADGHSVAFTITQDTRFFRGEKAARSEDVRVGQRAAVHGKRAGEALQATQVKLGAAPKSK